MKFFDGAVVYKWNWDQVAQAFWQRYPNPYSKHVLTEDILSRQIRDNCLFTRRLLTKTNSVPRWGERFIPSSARNMCIVEESIVDPFAKTITTYTRNIAMQNIMNVEEKCVYRVSPDNHKWTVCQKTAWISSPVMGVGAAIQDFGLRRFRKNASQASQGYEFVLHKLFTPLLHQASPKERLKERAIKVAQVAKDTAQAAKEKAPAAIMSPS